MRDGQVRSTEIEEVKEDHILTTIETPIRSDALKIDDELKIKLIEKNFK